MNMASTAGMSPVVKLSKPKALPVRRNIKKKVALVFDAGEAEITK